MCGRAICATSLDGCSRQGVRDRCTVSLTHNRRFYMRGLRYVPICAGFQFVQDRFDGCSREVIMDRYTVSLTCNRRFCIHGMLYVPMCVGVHFCARLPDGCSC